MSANSILRAALESMSHIDADQYGVDGTEELASHVRKISREALALSERAEGDYSDAIMDALTRIKFIALEALS